MKKTTLIFLMLAMSCLAQIPIGIKQNSFTTNSDPVAQGVVSNVVVSQTLNTPYCYVSGAGDSIANGYYSYDSTFAPYHLNYTNQYCSIYQNSGNEYWIFSGGQRHYISTNGIFGVYSLIDVGAPPVPVVSPAGLVSKITAGTLQSSGGITTNNYGQYMETNVVTTISTNQMYISLSGFETPSFNVTYRWLGILTNALVIGATHYNVSIWSNSASGNCIWAATNIQQWYIGHGVSAATRVYDDFAGVSPLVPPTSDNGVIWYIISSGTPSSGVSHYLITTNKGINLPYPAPSNPSLATQIQLMSATNSLYNSSTSFASQISLSTANSFYSNQTYLASLSNATPFGNFVLSSIYASNGGIVVSSNFNGTSWDYHLSLSGSSSNVVYVTNINAFNLQTWGALTTNYSSWQPYLAPRGDWASVSPFTNSMISTQSASLLYQQKGLFLTSASNLDYLKFTNFPPIPSTNGFITSSSLAPYAAIFSVTNANYLQSSSTGYYSMKSDTTSSVSAYATTANLNTASNAVAASNNLNSAGVLLKWGTNQAFVGEILVNSNMSAVFVTNGGIVTATLSSTTNLYNPQAYNTPTKNLTNWSAVPTNMVLISTNVITKIVVGNNMTATFITNSSGIMATLTVAAGLKCPMQISSFVSDKPTGQPGGLAWGIYSSGTTALTWPNTLPSAPSSVKFYSYGSDITAQVLANYSCPGCYISNTATGIVARSTNDHPASYTGQVIGICQ